MNIFATLKHDSDVLMQDDGWYSHIDKAIDRAVEFGYSGVVMPPHKRGNEKDDPNLATYLSMQAYGLDRCLDAGLDVILDAGDILSSKSGHIKHQSVRDLIFHPAVTELQVGDEPDVAGKEMIRAERDMNKILEYRPDAKFYLAMIGEHIGGATGFACNRSWTPDRWEQYTEWWDRYKSLNRVIRVFPERDRDKKVEPGPNNTFFKPHHIFGRFGLSNPHIPEKMAMQPQAVYARMNHKYGTDWTLAVQAYGHGVTPVSKGGKDNYWILPTKNELGDHLLMAKDFAGRAVTWALTQNMKKPEQIMLLDKNLDPVKDHNGTYPVEAIASIGQ